MEQRRACRRPHAGPLTLGHRHRYSGKKATIKLAACPWRMRLAAPEGHLVIHPAFLGERLLIAEDEPLITIELEHLLEQEGATVFSAACVSKALQLADVPALSAGIIDIRLGAEKADPVCEALDRRQVPFVLYTGNPETAQDRWPTAPVIGKPSSAAAIVGAIKYIVSADRRDILFLLSQDEAKVIPAERHLLDGEQRILRIKRLLTRLEGSGFDMSVAHKVLATMTERLDLMRRHHTLMASQNWRAATGGASN